MPFWENIYNLVETGAATDPLNLHVSVGSNGYQYLADAFWMSPEHRYLEVQSYYQNFLGRSLNLNNAVDAPQLEYWMNQFLAGATEADVIRGFLTSPQFLYDQRAATSLTAVLNTDLLAGTGTAADLQTWTTSLSALDAQRAALQNQTSAVAYDTALGANLNALDNETTQTGVLFNMLNSSEYETRALDSFYIAFLHRSATSGEVQTWMSELNAVANPLDLGNIAEEFLASPQYRANAVSSEV